MRRFLTASAVFLFIVLVILPPAVAVMPTVIGRILNQQAAVPKPAPTPAEGSDSLPIKVFFPQTKQVLPMSLAEYLKGVVAAEMPANFETEALRAQFVVARTYAVRRMKFTGAGRGGCSLNSTADICADPMVGQDYISKADADKKFGASAANGLWKRLDQVQRETEGLVVTFKGELIDPLYHSVSGTKTENSGDYFTQALPYLTSVDDSWGKDAPNLYDTKRFAPAELAKALSQGGTEIAAPVVAASAQAGKVPVQITEKTASGRVKTVKVGDTTITGREFRVRLELRSTAFTVTLEKGDVVVTTTGYGHGVGMSQYGANGMAKAGKTYADILAYYYKGTALTRIFDE